MNTETMITPTKAAEILELTRARVRQLVASGELKTAGRFGSTTMFSEAVVKELKKKRAGKKSGNGNRKAAK